MNVEASVLFIEIVQSWFHSWKDVIWVKTYNIMEKSSELIYFSSDLNIGSCIFIEKIEMLVDFILETIELWVVLVYNNSLFEHIKGVLCVFKFMDFMLEIFLKFF